MPWLNHSKFRSSRRLTGVIVLLTMLGVGCIAWRFWIPLKAQLAQHLLELAWQTSRVSGKPQKAWSWADSWPVAKLTIKALDLEVIVLREAGSEGLAFGPVLLQQSSAIGSKGTSVIAAHRDTHFKSLAHLTKGTLIQIEPMQGPPLTYQVSDLRVANWDQSGLSKDSQESQLVITSCWPFDSIIDGPLRFIATAKQVTDRPDVITAN